jgi:hypothetical protein
MLEIKAIVNVKLDCDTCGYDEVSKGVEIDAESWSDFEAQAMFAFQGWWRIESMKFPFITWACPSCYADEKAAIAADRADANRF